MLVERDPANLPETMRIAEIRVCTPVDHTGSRPES